MPKARLKNSNSYYYMYYYARLSVGGFQYR